jgi:hypothetical protein
MPRMIRSSALLMVLAAAVAVVGVTEAVNLLRAPAVVAPVRAATFGGLTAQVNGAGWLDMNHSAPLSGFQMPAAMMPGMPTGDDQRLAVRITVENASDGTRALHPSAEFTLRTAGGKHWTAVSTSFADLPRLGSGNAVDGSLYFDLPPADLTTDPFWLDWAHPDGHQQLAVPVAGAAPAHQH